MTAPLWIDRDPDTGAPEYPANLLRQAMALPLMYDGRAMGARQGVRPGADQLVSLSGSVITVQPHLACIDPGLTNVQGPYWVPIPVAENPGPLEPADASNPRRDLVIDQLYDTNEDQSGLRLARPEYIAGVPGPAPAAPDVPAGAILLAMIDVPRDGGGAPAVTPIYPYVVAAGGILPVRGAADIVAAVEGRYRDRLDIDTLERDRGDAWETIADPNIFKPWQPYVPGWSATGTQPALGDGSLSGRWIKIGKTFICSGNLSIGAGTTFGTGVWTFSLPVPLQSIGLHIGQGWTYDASGIPRPAAGWVVSAGLVRFTAVSGGDVSPTNPQTWEAGDQLRWTFIGEEA